MVRPALFAVALVAAATGCGSSRSNTKPDAGGNGGGAGAGGRGGAVASGGFGGGGGGTGGTGGAGGAVGAGGAGATSGSGGAGVAGATGGAGTSGTGGGGGSGGGGTTGGASGSGVAGATGGASGSGGGGASGGAGGAAGDAGPFYPLDMNDVTILAPLPASTATPVLLRGLDPADDGTALVPRALFDRLVNDAEIGGRSIVASGTYERVHLVAVRFDLCDRHLPGPCPEAEDARLRLVFQPLAVGSVGVEADDVGFHAFYTIRNDEIPGAVRALRDLARIAPSQSGPLRVSPALAAADPAAYAAKLRAFVKRYGGDARIVRLTMNARSRISAQILWMLRGVEAKEGVFGDIKIAGSTAIIEQVAFGGSPSFDVMPVTDTPAGFQDAIRSWIFDGADLARKRELMVTLAAVENPLSHTAETIACVGCHVSTVLMKARAASSGIDPETLPGRYTARFDLSIAGGKSADSMLTIRALGHFAKEAMISQRVANDTAQTLTEIEHRFPAR